MWIWLIVAIFIPLLIWDYLNKKHRNEILQQQGISGPLAVPLFGCAFNVKSVSAEKLLNFVDSCFDKYGKTFRMWVLNESIIFTKDIKLLEAVYNSNTLLDKGDLYNLLRSWLHDGLLLSVGKKWRGRRKVFTPAFHFKALECYVNIFDEQSEVFVKQLEKMADGKTVIDIFPKICLAAMDVITETAMGVKVNAQQNPDFPYTKALKDVVYIQPSRMLNFLQRFDWMFKLTAPKLFKTVEDGIKTMHDFTTKVIEERRENLQRSIADGTYKPIITADNELGTKEQMALLDILLQSTIDGKPLTNDEIREEVDTFMFEGDDTTTSAVSHSLYLIARHPEVQEKLFAEIMNVMGKDKDAPITIQQLQQLQYMNCVIKEVLRLHPSVPAIGRKTLKDVDLNGFKLPANSSIYLVLYFAHRDPDYFPDPEKFKPERFEADSHGDNPLTSSFAYTPFSAGPKNCIGQKFAVLEIKSMLSKMLRYYQLLPLGAELKPMLNFILRSSTGANIGLLPRVYK